MAHADDRVRGPGGERRVVAVAWRPGRREPDQRSEMTTQWLFGERLRVLGGEGAEGPWLRVRGPDAYESWIRRGGLWDGAAPDVASWEEAATARSLGVRLTAGSDADGVPRGLPWGARAAVAGEGRLRLPGGAVASFEPSDGIVEPGAREERFPPRGEAVAATALRWRGAPYLWGGRTREGADCSGFAQAVYLLHGVVLPRDSGDQLAAGPSLPVGDGGPDDRSPDAVDAADWAGGDLLFFGDGPDDVTHVAVVVEGTRIVHAAASNGSVAVDDVAGGSALERRLRRRLVRRTRPLASG